MPGIFSLDDNFIETVEYLTELRTKLRSSIPESKIAKAITRRARRHILSYNDFSTINKISPAAALVLAAEFDRWRIQANTKLFTVNERFWKPEVLSVLYALGFHELLDMRPPGPHAAEIGTLRILRFSSGDQAEGEYAGTLQDSLAILLPEDDAERLLYIEPYAGIFEAILNSRSWAYPENFDWEHEPVRRWWITGAVDSSKRQVTVVAYDQGISIPVSLPRWKHYGRFQQTMQRIASRYGLAAPFGDPSYDGTAIRLAMDIARTATDMKQHGKGLHTMREVAERATHGRLRILSRAGEYVWETGRKPLARNHPLSIGGTLIEWQLQL